jgi:sugar lactone lactonase YvrE
MLRWNLLRGLTGAPSGHQAQDGARKYRRRPRPLFLEEFEARLCLSNGPYLLVTSYGNDSVMRYAKTTGNPLPSDGHTGATFVGEGESPLSTPLDILYTPDGYLLVDSAEDNDILRYDGQTGQYLSLLVPPSTPNLAGPTGMIFSPDGTALFVASVGNHEVLRFDYANGVASNPAVFISDPAINLPAALVFGPDGNLYVGSLNNSSVERYDPTGAPLPAPGQTGADFVPSGSGGLNRTAGVVFGPDGNLYVSSETSSEVMRYDGTTGDPLPGDGQSGAVFIPQVNGLNQPAGMVFGPGSKPGPHMPRGFDLYVVNIQSNNIVRFDGTTGNFVSEFIPDGSGGLSHPRDVTFGNTDPSSLDYIYPQRGGGTMAAEQQMALAAANAATLAHLTVGSSAAADRAPADHGATPAPASSDTGAQPGILALGFSSIGAVPAAAPADQAGTWSELLIDELALSLSIL